MTPKESRAAAGAGACVVAFLLWVGAGSAAAGVIRVPTDVASFRIAVQNAAPGDTVQLVGNGGATYVNADVRIDKDLMIQGGWRADFQVRDPYTYVSVIRDTSDLFDKPLLRITGPHRVTIDGVWIWGGRTGVLADSGPELALVDCVVRGQRNPSAAGDQDANRGGGIRIVGGSLRLTACRITSITTAYSGAAFAAISSSFVHVQNSQIDNCTASRAAGDASGAGIYARGVSDFRMEDSAISQCATVQDGGLVYLSATPATFVRSTLARGLASRNGGAIFLDGPGPMTVEECTFSESRGILGGAIHARNSAGVVVRDCSFNANRASDEGGALWFSGVDYSIEGTSFEANHLATFPSSVIADKGGCVYAVSSDGDVTDTSFRNERSLGKGGAWFQVGGETRFLRARFEDNDAVIFGGGLSIELGGLIRLDRCLLARNSAKFGGGVSASFTGAVEMDRCTLTGGAGRSAGAGVYVDTAGSIRMLDTIACCGVEGDVIYCAGGGVTADHCIVWNDDTVNIRREWGGACDDPSGTDGNLAVDPQLCPADPDFAIAATSPGAGTASDGGDRGWRPAGCSGVTPLAVEPQSWGRVKARWRQ